jgi:hypothetical protein
MKLIYKVLSVFFLFIFSGVLPKLIADLFATGVKSGFEALITNMISVAIAAVIIKYCLFVLETKNENKRLWELQLPTQTNQLTPLLLGLILGIQNAVRYYQTFGG